MDFLKPYILSIVTFLPMAGAALIILLARNEESVRRMALGVSLLAFAISLLLIGWYTDPELTENVPWIASLGISYHLQIDGLSLWLVILSTLLIPISNLASWTAVHKRVREYMVFMLLLETGM